MSFYIKLIQPEIIMPYNFQWRFPEQTFINGETGTGSALWHRFMQLVKIKYKTTYYKEHKKVQVTQIRKQVLMYF